MASHSSATVRKQAPRLTQTPHGTQTTRTATIINALTRRAQAALNDTSIDPQSRAVLRYALETNDPWLAELVRRADASEAPGDTGETIVDTINFSRTPETNGDDSSEGKIRALAEIICRAGDEAGTKSAALVVLMATLENATHPKALANLAKHVAFSSCGELNLYGIVDSQVAVLEGELLA